MNKKIKTQLSDFSVYFDKRMFVILLLGFSSGLPLLLVMSTLSLWLTEEGLSLAAIGAFSLVRTPYGFKFLWAPFIDKINIPFFTKKLGRRKAFGLLIQILLMLSILGMASFPPSEFISITVFFAILVAFFSASQDIVIDAFRIEILQKDEQGAGSAMAVLGYRFRMLVSGAGAVWFASLFSWQIVYAAMALLVLIGITTLFFAKEPELNLNNKPLPKDFKSFFKDVVISPFKNFAQNPSWLLIILFVMLYKLCDAYLGPMVFPFYADIGFSKEEIAKVIQIYGMGATISGGFIGGVIVKRYGIIKSLFIGGILQAASNFMYVFLAMRGHDVPFLVFTVTIENVSGGIGTTAFVAYISSLCNVAYTATQYAILSSFPALGRDLISSSSGILAKKLGWTMFFSVTTLFAIPAMIMLYFMIKKFPVNSSKT